MTQQQTTNNQLTPLEKLTFEKRRLQEECRLQANKLNDDFAYIQENTGSLLMSGLSALLFPHSKQTASKGKRTSSNTVPAATPVDFGLSGYLSIAKGMLPVVWDVVQPIIMTWGIKKAQKWLVGLFSSKKK